MYFPDKEAGLEKNDQSKYVNKWNSDIWPFRKNLGIDISRDALGTMLDILFFYRHSNKHCNI